MTARVSSPVTRADAASLDRQFGDQIALLVPMLRRFAHRLCGQRALADDLTQEAIMRAWAARATFIQNTPWTM
ncbi:DNA-directed RNA polymerase specialized sigma24 family protein [Novosphingobium sp. SG751A]|uniref:RNA polymerase sigma factor n=1 Tax=Novosphingobium sp. SG751A TaxID=2587000 RepID=UPI001557D6EC|nr:sigma factor [Novosphingobium sp. SG751A]NOW46483.1 DNA-directed RNA polymerase specialized sigma24 family protein [Novosphingobium sp. SG751A]